jgi:hypothetical protein
MLLKTWNQRLFDFEILKTSNIEGYNNIKEPSNIGVIY